MSAAELRRERHQLVDQLAASVQGATGCDCGRPPALCAASTAAVTTVLAIAAGYAGLAGAPLTPPLDDLARTAAHACQLVVAAGAATALPPGDPVAVD